MNTKEVLNIGRTIRDLLQKDLNRLNINLIGLKRIDRFFDLKNEQERVKYDKELDEMETEIREIKEAMSFINERLHKRDIRVI